MIKHKSVHLEMKNKIVLINWKGTDGTSAPAGEAHAFLYLKYLNQEYE
jgi:hypothetical protein